MPCDWSTPLGRPVVPDVKASPMISVSSITIRGSTSSPWASRSSYATKPSSSVPSPSRATSVVIPPTAWAELRATPRYRSLANIATGSARPSRVVTSDCVSLLLSGTYVAPSLSDASTTS